MAAKRRQSVARPGRPRPELADLGSQCSACAVHLTWEHEGKGGGPDIGRLTEKSLRD